MKHLFYLFLLTTLLFSCKKDFNHKDFIDHFYDKDNNNGNNYTGFIYTSTNATYGNAIIALGRHRDGTVEELKGSPYHTGSRGDAAEGDFDTQWALRIVGDYLLAVNAGANPVHSTISVFKINKANGRLEQIDQDPTTPIMNNMNSHGVRAASIAAKTIGGQTWIVVGNQFANPNYQGSPAVAFGSIVSTPDRNLAVFTLNQASGQLSFKRIGATYMDGDNGGPVTVDFNAAGTKIAVSTWGVSHFATPDADLKLQKPGRLYIYDFSDGNLSQTGMFEEEGISGNIGLSWSPNDQYIYMSNFNLHSSKETNSLTVHDVTGAKVQHFATAGRNDEGCWTWVSIDKHKLYVASFGENVVSTFSILSDNLLEKTLEPNFFKRRGQLPTGDTKDMHETSDGYLYVSGAFQSHTLTAFKTSLSGMLSEIAGSPYYIPTSLGKSKEEHAYLGLTGFDKNNLNNKQQ